MNFNFRPKAVAILAEFYGVPTAHNRTQAKKTRFAPPPSMRREIRASKVARTGPLPTPIGGCRTSDDPGRPQELGHRPNLLEGSRRQSAHRKRNLRAPHTAAPGSQEPYRDIMLPQGVVPDKSAQPGQPLQAFLKKIERVSFQGRRLGRSQRRKIRP